MEIQYNRKVQLGEGGYGSVFQGTFKGREVAVKRVLLNMANDNEEEALRKLDHPNIVKLFHVECDKDFKVFALELCTASLDQVILRPDHPEKYKGPKLPYHFEVFSQLASGLEYIHSKNIIHRDIKPENVLISVNSSTNTQDVKVTMKWADFGLSRAVNERGTYPMSSGVKGTRNWYAPELLKLLLQESQTGGQRQLRGTVKSDVFALGLVFAYLLLNGQHIYGSNEIEIINNILGDKAINMNKIERWHYAYDLVTEMLKNEAADRISSSNIVDRLKSEENKLAEKEKELFELCKIRYPATSRIFPSTNQNEKLKTLIQQGVDVNKKNKDGDNALHLLCCNNSSERLIDAIKILIQHGIDVNEKNNYGDNALHISCLHNSSKRLIDAIKLLIQLGINVNEKDEDGRNALHLMCWNNSSERLIDAIKLLIQLGININEKDEDGDNALHYLCRNNSNERLIDAIKLLIQLGINVNEKSNNGYNALHLLCQFNSSEGLIDAIKLLIQLGIDVKEKDNYGHNALHSLCWNNSSERLIDAIKLLIRIGIDVNEKDEDGNNALHLLCWNNSSERLIDSIKLLIRIGIDVNEKNKDGNNALHVLCHDRLIFLEVKNNVTHFTTETGKPCTIPCKPTHPNVAVDLFWGMIFELYEKVYNYLKSMWKHLIPTV
ncbi:sensor for unfolded proteins in the ER ire1-like [Daphnia pulex]|uniref:sensor for unfolded proteins in the ER ire1-like n=1 Tax=Daphnia pulex TaxID=6669 RepID=UPI001EDCED49|nr:sensor for unfolded proteins in the ER ire1-like [Daphnia pulex]